MKGCSSSVRNASNLPPPPPIVSLIQVIEPIPFAPIKGADVLYLLDGGSFVGLAVSVSQSLQMAMTTRPIYVVAVTFLGKTFPELVAQRWRDLAHDPVKVNKETLGGGGGKFEAFLTEELQPFIEAHYPVDHAKSALAGDSLSGLFAVHVLAWKPDAFSAYLIGSPSLWAGEKELIGKVRGRRSIYDSCSQGEAAGIVDGRALSFDVTNNAAQVGPLRGIAIDEAKSISVCKLYEAGLGTIAAQLNVLRQFWGIDAGNGIIDRLLHTGLSFFLAPSGGAHAEGFRRVADAQIECLCACRGRYIQIPISDGVCHRLMAR